MGLMVRIAQTRRSFYEVSPLWGDHSYNEAAGLYRVSTFAGYIKTNMPFGATADNPQLSDEEAWDLAAFVNGQPRPKHKFLATDWPQINKNLMTIHLVHMKIHLQKHNINMVPINRS